MAMPGPTIRVESPFAIGPWSVDPRKNIIERDDHRVRIEPKAMRVLVHLASRAGEDVSKEEILRAVWGELRANGDVLTNAIWELRKAFGDDSREPDFIQTVPRRGYRLVAPVAARPLPSRDKGTPLALLWSWLRSLAGPRQPVGFVEGQRAALLRVLKSRFGSPSDELVKRILALDSSEEIDAYLDRAASARSSNELETD